jgi:uncharacterized protein (TIGR02268 family)
VSSFPLTLLVVLLLAAGARAQGDSTPRGAAEPKQLVACEPGGITELLLARVMDARGIQSKDLRRRMQVMPGASLEVVEAASLRSLVAVAVVLSIRVPEGAARWRYRRAALRDESGGTLLLRVTWPRTRLEHGENLIIVEADATMEQARGTYVLELHEADGKHTFTLGNVEFP